MRHLFRALAILPLLLSTSCGDSELRQAVVCADFCAAKEACQDEFDTTACVERCQKGLGNCQADEVKATLTELATCADQECGTLGICRVGAEAQCHLGL